VDGLRRERIAFNGSREMLFAEDRPHNLKEGDDKKRLLKLRITGTCKLGWE
jgi:hypothetical protein